MKEFIIEVTKDGVTEQYEICTTKLHTALSYLCQVELDKKPLGLLFRIVSVKTHNHTYVVEEHPGGRADERCDHKGCGSRRSAR